jgi:hypothetical protein
MLAPRRLGVAAALISCLVFPAGSEAHERWPHDPNDVRGAIDIRRVGIGHDRQRFYFGIETYGRWRPRLLRRKANFILVNLDSRGGTQLDYLAEVRFRRGKLRTSIYRIVDRPDTDVEGKRYVGYGNTSRSGRLLVLDFPRR